METCEADAINELRYQHAGLSADIAALRLLLLLRANPFWHLQPRVPGGLPEGGQWTAVGAAGSLLPVLRHVAIASIRRLREIARRVAPLLRRVPRRWDEDVTLPSDDDYDRETRRIGPPSWHRHGHPNLRFSSEAELRRFLGPAGEGRQWHHIVEQRLADNGRFPAELIHSTDNILSLPVDVHGKINAIMSAKDSRYGGATRRRWMERFSYGEQYNMGLELIEQVATELGYDLDRL